MGVEIYGLLTGSSIHALGASGRPEVPELLQRLRKSPPQETGIPEHLRSGFEGAIVQAAYYSDLLHEKGVDEFFAWFSLTTDIFDEDGSWSRWKATPNGGEWMKWFNQRMAEKAK